MENKRLIVSNSQKIFMQFAKNLNNTTKIILSYLRSFPFANCVQLIEIFITELLFLLTCSLKIFEKTIFN
jgi:hypothetical protein